ncbi:MAG TPA: hypothetical protein VKQ08_11345 [Cyclobacteriaceae bacterium]|nr:hypothetical protein [Cyclobacteriaceae bacterium]
MKGPLVLLSMLVFISCSRKEGHHESGDWKALDDFHAVMARAYHPLKDSGSVASAKNLIRELVAGADKLLTEPLPKKVDNAAMKSDIEKLKADTQRLATEINNGANDELVKEKLTALHDQFHKIMEGWHRSGKEGDDEDDHGED